MAKFNLLPAEVAPSKEVTRATKILNSLAVFSSAAFIVLALAGGSAFVYFNSKLNSLKTSESSLKNNIQNLQATESQLVLLKDRLSKIQNIIASREKESTFAKHKLVAELLPEDVVFEGSDLELSNSTIKITSGDSLALEALIKNMLVQNTLTSLTLSDLNYNPFLGYELKFEVR
ncbi:hypothetical protein C4564_00325 [Candidatus Microgenomates bacterium]|nr:MAG: hypothetical protein C4564_00325 [Candidatus Microgenomates bacterium]